MSVIGPDWLTGAQLSTARRSLPFIAAMSAGRLSVLVSLLAASALTACGSSGSGSSTQSTAAGASTATAPSSTAPAPSATSTASAANQPLGPEAIPLEAGPPLAPASTTTSGATVDGIECAAVEQLAYHIHSHLQVYAAGQPRALPGGIGIVGPEPPQQTPEGPFYEGGQCIYWLHTHTSDGVIHIESPTKRVYTLGNFFDEWSQPLNRTQVAGVKGKVTAYLNGKRWTRDPRAIPLLAHGSIQLDVGSPAVAPKVISWAGANL
jgi:hypothetical protein